MLMGALIGAGVGIIVVLIQTAKKKKMQQGESLDSNIKSDNNTEEEV